MVLRGEARDARGSPRLLSNPTWKGSIMEIILKDYCHKCLAIAQYSKANQIKSLALRDGVSHVALSLIAEAMKYSLWIA